MSDETKQRDDGGSAFPFQCQGPTTAPEFYYGMSLRMYLAAKAIPFCLRDYCGEDGLPPDTDNKIPNHGGKTYRDRRNEVLSGVAKDCLAIADAIIAASK